MSPLPFNLAIASGKGGTGKTTLSTAIALSVDHPVQYLDCDVEAPNGSLFIRPQWQRQESVCTLIPVVDPQLCDGCGKCSEFCQFNAIIASKRRGQAWVYPELCHSCGGCQRVCPQRAITEAERPIGVIEAGQRGAIEFIQGRLNIRETLSTGIIKAVKQHIRTDCLTLIDCPPGTSCPMLTSVRDMDFVILVTEPTPFGLHDLTLAVQTVQQLNLPFGVVINRFDSGDSRVETYCEQRNIDILLRIPGERRIAKDYSEGKSLLDSLPGMAEKINAMLAGVQQKLAEE